MTFSQSSISQLKNIAQMNTLFEYKATEQFKSEFRVVTIAKNNNIGFVVYDAQRSEQSLLNSKWLVVYSNNKYIICKINLNQQ